MGNTLIYCVFLIREQSKGYLQGIDYDELVPSFITDVSCASIFVSEQEAINKMIEIITDFRYNDEVYEIVKTWKGVKS